MNEDAEMEAAFNYKQFSRAQALLEDLVGKIVSAIQSPDIVEWRVPGLQIQLARAYEALSRDEDAEAAYASAAELSRRIDSCPTSEAFVQFAVGEFYLRRRMHERALDVTILSIAKNEKQDMSLLQLIRMQAYAKLGRRSESTDAAQGFITAASDKAAAQQTVRNLLGADWNIGHVD